MRSVKVLTALALGFAACLIMAAMASAAPGATNKIQGTVKDALGRPLSGANLVLKAPDETIIARTRSDADGNFGFSGLNPGTYAVLAEKPGFEAGTAIVTVEAGTTGTAALTLAAQEALEVKLAAERLNRAQNSLSPKTGGSIYNFSQQDITALPLGQNTPFNQVLLQAPGVANDSFGQLHVRGDHANLQYRIDGIIMPEGITGFGQVLQTRFASNIDLLTGALPAQYGQREAGVIEIQTKTLYENGGRVDFYGGSQTTLNPSFEYGGSEGKWNYFVTGAYLGDNLGIENPTSAQNAIHDHTDQATGFGYASYLLDPTSRVFVMFGNYNGSFQIPNNPGQTPQFLQAGQPNFASKNLNENQYETNRYAALAYQSTIGKDFDYQISYVNRYTSVHFVPDLVGDLAYNGVSSNVSQSSFINQWQGDGSYRLNDAHTIRMGFSTSYEDTTSINYSTVFPTSGGNVSGYPFTIKDNEPKNGNILLGTYIQDEWKPFAKWTVNYGLRFDYMNAFVTVDQLSPRFGLVYKVLTDTTLHAGYARYFTPPPTELILTKSISLYQNTSNAPAINQNSAVLPERSNYYDAGVIQKITPAAQIGLDAFYKTTKDLIDEGQFGQALIFAPFNYAQGKIWGLELTGNYHAGNWAAYANIARTVSLAREVVSGQYNFSQDELNYIAQSWIHTDHDQLYTISSGVSYRWWETLFSVDLTYGSGLRSGFANRQTVPDNVQVNLGVKRKFELVGIGPVELRLAVLNVFDRINEIRTGTGIGVFAPQYGPRLGFFGGLTKIF
ncbi:MAG: TonB-dependent receptor [Desulfobaccales bacterium]